MKILVIGAGVLGSNLAHCLLKHNDVNLLARGKTYSSIKENGLIIKPKFSRRSIDHIKLIDKLESNDIYDAIFVTVRFSQLDSIIPLLMQNPSKNIVFVGNNINASKYSNLENKNVLFAFFSAAGKRNGNVVESICLKKITIGRIDGKDYDNEFIKSIFKKTPIKPTIENRMDDWLKCHAVVVLPLVFACYRTNGNLKLIKNDKEYSLRIIDAIVEGYDVLKKLGYKILPEGEHETCAKKRNKCAAIYRFMFSNFIGKIAISDHAMNAKEEFQEIDKEFTKLKEESGLETKIYDELKLSMMK